MALRAFDEKNLYIRVGNSLDRILENLEAVSLQQPLHQVSIPVYVFALITFFQYQEKVTDDDMARWVRNRPEFRYGLRLPLRHPQISAIDLCHYRYLLFTDSIFFRVFKQITDRIIEFTQNENSNGKNGRHPMHKTVCVVNRTDKIISTMLETIGSLAATQPNWIREIAPSYWYERYSRSSEKFIKITLEKSNYETILEIGNDIKHVLDRAKHNDNLANCLEIQSLMRVFDENFELSQDKSQLGWKPVSCALCLRSVTQMREVNQNKIQ